MNPLRTIQKIILSILFIVLISDSFAQTDSSYKNHLGIGVKFDNPAGISIKKYYGNKAIELSAGRFSSWNYHRHFYRKYRHEYKGYNYSFVDYDAVDYPIAIQLHYLVHKDTWFRRLTWYYGAGAQFRHARFYYEFTYEDAGIFITERKKIDYTGIGVDGVLGLEYTFKNVPLSVFYDASLYIEVLEHPLYMKLQTGLGVRYNF